MPIRTLSTTTTLALAALLGTTGIARAQLWRTDQSAAAEALIAGRERTDRSRRRRAATSSW